MQGSTTLAHPVTCADEHQQPLLRVPAGVFRHILCVPVPQVSLQSFVTTCTCAARLVPIQVAHSLQEVLQTLEKPMQDMHRSGVHLT